MTLVDIKQRNKIYFFGIKYMCVINTTLVIVFLKANLRVPALRRELNG